MANLTTDYDVVIVGGGPAGASAAIHLARQGARVLLVERKQFPRPKLCGEFISPECLDHFARLGVLDSMLAAGGRYIRETAFYSASGRSAEVPSRWLGASYALGLSRAEMDLRLLQQARLAGVDVMEEVQAKGLLIEEDRVRGVQVMADGDIRTFTSLVTIDATGRARDLARRVEAENTGKQLKPRRRLVAFKTHLEGVRGMAGRCEIYFYRGGYGGLSRVEGGLSNLCFVAPADEVRARAGDAEHVMRDLVMSNHRAAQMLAQARPCSPWLAVVIESFGLGEPAPMNGLITAGDAASFIDPFTGSGILMALEGGELAADTIARRLPALRTGEGFSALADEYRLSYANRFGPRLRVCRLLRQAALAPPIVIEAAVFALGVSGQARRRLATGTRSSTQLSGS